MISSLKQHDVEPEFPHEPPAGILRPRRSSLPFIRTMPTKVAPGPDSDQERLGAPHPHPAPGPGPWAWILHKHDRCHCPTCQDSDGGGAGSNSISMTTKIGASFLPGAPKILRSFPKISLGRRCSTMNSHYQVRILSLSHASHSSRLQRWIRPTLAPFDEEVSTSDPSRCEYGTQASPTCSREEMSG